MINIKNHITNNTLKILVKPNSPKIQITGYNKSKQAIKVNIKAPPEKGKANKEIIKFFSKLLKRKVEITKGLKSKEKILKIK